MRSKALSKLSVVACSQLLHHFESLDCVDVVIQDPLGLKSRVSTSSRSVDKFLDCMKYIVFGERIRERSSMIVWTFQCMFNSSNDYDCMPRKRLL